MNIEQATAYVEKLTSLAMSGPDGLQQVVDSLGPITIYQSERTAMMRPSNMRADLMRGIAKLVIPKEWEFEVVEVVNGECRLFVTRTG